MKRLALSIALATALILPTTVSASGSASFNLGFKAVADLIPDVVGTPLENEHYGANGDSLQMTTRGLMVWRKADNWTAFTNGTRTWINGPYGLQERANEERFDWEAASEVSPVSSSPAPPAPTSAPQPVQAAPTQDTEVAEMAALDMINRSRQENGVAPLVMDESLRLVSRAHARDMSVRNFFAHVNPDGLQPWDRARAAGITYSIMAENIGWSLGYSSPTDGVRSNHQAMMAEAPPNDGHRVNILNPLLKRIGIGVFKGPDGKVFYVTDFVG